MAVVDTAGSWRWALADVPAADDPEQLARLARMGSGELFAVSTVLRLGEAATVAEAVEDLEERGAACAEADRRRAGFRAL